MKKFNVAMSKLILTTSIALTGFIANNQVVSANIIETDSQVIVSEAIKQTELVNYEQDVNSETQVIIEDTQSLTSEETIETEVVDSTQDFNTEAENRSVSIQAFSVTDSAAYGETSQAELIDYDQKFNSEKVTSSEGIAYHSIAGANRYDNAAAISQNTFETADTVYMVNGVKEADALTGVVLAANEEAPILLTYGNKLADYTEAELKRLETKNVVLLGGERSIEQGVVQGLDALNINVERIGGVNRYAQAALVADLIIANNGGSVTEAFLTNGYASADALSISSVAADRKAPVFLTGAARLDAAVRPYVSKIAKWTVVGGANSVSEAVLTELKNLGASVTRISGANRYEVNRNIIDKYHSDKDHFFVASGEVFSDALPVSVTASVNNSGVLLVKNNATTIAKQTRVLNTNDKITFVGGTKTVTAQTRQAFTDQNKYSNAIAKQELSKVRSVPSKAEYVVVNDNIPYFSNKDITSTTAYYKIGAFDSSGRVTQANALLGVELMPAEQRGATPDYKPTGWNQKNYTNVPGGWLYHRSHLIGHQLVGDDTNQNLMTGTQWFNQDAMLPFENFVANYIESTGNHVRYRITPVFQGTNKLASGIYMEGFSIEDNGKEVQFNIYVPNRQPGVTIKYNDGSSNGPQGPQPYDPKVPVKLPDNLKGIHDKIIKKAPNTQEAIKAGKVDTNSNGTITIAEAEKAGFKMPIRRDVDWLYKYMTDNDNDGLVGE